MNCQDFENLVLPMARNQLLDAAVREQGLAHTEVCDRCAAHLTEERALLAGVRVVVSELADQAAPARVETVLLTAFRQQGRQQGMDAASPAVFPPTWQRPVKTWQRANLKLAAIAAGILILISVLASFWQRPNLPDERQAAGINSPTPSVTPAPQPIEPVVDRNLDLAEHPVIPRPRQRMRHGASTDDSDEAEVVTEFFPLREGEDLAVLEGGLLVRVELPGSALGEVGLPVNPETANTTVKADVVLGDDGLARAIRFVR